MATPDKTKLFKEEQQRVAKVFNAVKQGNVKRFKQLLDIKLKADGNKDIDAYRDANGRTFLHFACRFGKLAMVKYLLSRGSKVNARDKELRTPISLAVELPSIDVVKYLIEHKELKVNLNAITVAKRTLLHYAVQAGSPELVEYLIDSGVPKDEMDSVGSPLLYAVLEQQTEMVEVLLKKGCDVNKKNAFDGATILMMACSIGADELIPVLINNGAKVDGRNKEEWTALHCAADSGRLDIVRFLSKTNMDLNAVENTGKTALDMAEKKGYIQVSSYLESIGAKKGNEAKEEIIEDEEKEETKKQKTEVSEDDKKAALEKKAEGNKAFAKGDMEEALTKYSEAIKLNPMEPIYYSNRSASYLKMGKLQEALTDANKVIELNREWSKGHFRAGMVYFHMKNYSEAAVAFFEGIQVEPNNEDLNSWFKKAVKKGKAHHGLLKKK